MLVALDIGNTTTTIGLFRSDELVEFRRIRGGEIPKSQIFRPRSGRGESAVFVVSSVVPQRTPVLRRNLAGRFRSDWYEIGREVRLQLKHKYNNFNRLGNDRKVNLYGALHLYKAPCLIVDAGTAITFDLLSGKGVFEGGLIFPGAQLSAEALFEKTALLPLVSCEGRVPKKIVGRSTEECIQAGLKYGYTALIAGVIGLFRKAYGKALLTIGTGGGLDILGTSRQYFDVVDPILAVRSLYLIYQSEILGRNAGDIKIAGLQEVPRRPALSGTF